MSSSTQQSKAASIYGNGFSFFCFFFGMSRTFKTTQKSWLLCVCVYHWVASKGGRGTAMFNWTTLESGQPLRRETSVSSRLKRMPKDTVNVTLVLRMEIGTSWANAKLSATKHCTQAKHLTKNTQRSSKQQQQQQHPSAHLSV